MDFDSFNKKLAEYSDDLVKSHQIFCGRVLNFGSGERGVITNGRVRNSIPHCNKYSIFQTEIVL